jgi:hypothetical protein
LRKPNESEAEGLLENVDGKYHITEVASNTVAVTEDRSPGGGRTYDASALNARGEPAAASECEPAVRSTAAVRAGMAQDRIVSPWISTGRFHLRPRRLTAENNLLPANFPIKTVHGSDTALNASSYMKNRN